MQIAAVRVMQLDLELVTGLVLERRMPAEGVVGGLGGRHHAGDRLRQKRARHATAVATKDRRAELAYGGFVPVRRHECQALRVEERRVAAHGGVVQATETLVDEVGRL